MKKTLLEITEMPEALAAYNSALQRAMLVMKQKNVYEATAAITVKTRSTRCRITRRSPTKPLSACPSRSRTRGPP